MVDDNQIHSAPPSPPGLPINWGLITGPVQPVVNAPSLSGQLPPSQSSAVHTLQTKLKSHTQRRTRGRDREKERERWDAEVLLSSPVRQISSELPLRQRPSGTCQASRPCSSWRSGAAKTSSSSDEEQEVEVQVRLEIHSPPAEAQGEQVFQKGADTEVQRNEGQACGFHEGNSEESLLFDTSISSKDGPALPPLPVLSSSLASSSVSATSSSSPSTSCRHWAPPKGFWRVARPETLVLNGVASSNVTPTLPLKDCTQSQGLTGPQRKSKPAETPSTSDVGSTVDDSNALSEFKDTDTAECYLDRCEQREVCSKGLCSSDSWESVSSHSGVLTADERLKVKQRAYAKLKERQQKCREAKVPTGGESASHEDTIYKVDCKGRSHTGNAFNN